MALLATSLKGRNVTIHRKPSAEVDQAMTTAQNQLSEVVGSETKLKKDIKNDSKAKSKIEKGANKSHKAALKILNTNDFVNKINNFFLDTCCSTCYDCQILQRNKVFQTLNGKQNSEEMLQTLLKDTLPIRMLLGDPNGKPPTPSRTTVVTETETIVFFAGGDSEANKLIANLDSLYIKDLENGTITNKINTKKTNLATAQESAKNLTTKAAPDLSRYGKTVLVGVSGISLEYSSTVGAENSLSNPVLQGWYNLPIKIMISGISYLGAFEKLLPFFPDAGDTTKDNIRNLFLDNDKLFKDNLQLTIQIDIENEGSFEGLVSSVKYSEDVTTPYLINYGIEFIGFRIAEDPGSKSQSRSAFDLSTAFNIVPNGKGIDFLMSSVTPKL